MLRVEELQFTLASVGRISSRGHLPSVFSGFLVSYYAPSRGIPRRISSPDTP